MCRAMKQPLYEHRIISSSQQPCHYPSFMDEDTEVQQDRTLNLGSTEPCLVLKAERAA